MVKRQFKDDPQPPGLLRQRVEETLRASQPGISGMSTGDTASLVDELNELLEQEVAERNSELEMLSEVAAMASRPANGAHPLHACLQRVCEHHGWVIGHAWLPADRNPEELLPGYAWYANTPLRFDRLRELISAAPAVMRGEGLAGRVFDRGEPEFATSIGGHLAVDSPALAEPFSIRSVSAFPLLAGETAVGVLEFFSEEPTEPTERLLKSMARVGALLGCLVEREQATRILHVSEQRHRTLLDAAGDAIISIDGRGVITSVNQATERIFGYATDELIGQNVSLLMPSPYWEAHDGYIARYQATREPRIIGMGRELFALRKDGTVFPIELEVNEVAHMNMFVGIIHDISQRRALEGQVVDATAAEQRRIGQDIHDGLGQELTGLRYMAQTHAETLAEQSSPEAKVAERMTQWLETVQRQLRAIIRELVPVEVDQQGLAVALRRLAQRTTETHDLVCAFECACTFDCSSDGEPEAALATQLYRIAQEAVANAVRHAHAAHVTIRLDEDNDVFRLEIADDGVGIGSLPESNPGIGLRTMGYRAGFIGARLNVKQAEQGGTVITCEGPRRINQARREET